MTTTSSKKHPENTPSDDTKTPEVPSEVRDRKTSETSPDETITPPSGGHKIHPLWYVIIGLILLNFLTIYRYERRIDRLERVPIIQMRKNLPSPPPPVDRRERMEHMMQSQEDWMQAQTSKSYAGMQAVGDEVWQYKITQNNDSLHGTISSSNPDLLGPLAEKIKNLGYSTVMT